MSNGHYTSQHAQGGGNVQHVSATYGPNVVAKQTGNQALEQTGNAFWSTAPYKPKGRRSTPKVCPIEGCKAWRSLKWGGVCALHGRWGYRPDGTKMSPEEFDAWKAEHRGDAE